MVMGKRMSTAILMKWNTHEDELLKELVRKYPEGNWSKISKKLKEAMKHNDQEKSPIECSKRWRNLQKSNLTNWTKKEDYKLLDLVETYNKKWFLFVKHFNFRNKNQIKTHYEYLMRNKGPPKRKGMYSIFTE
jgi:hypothetical protein